MFNVLIVDDNPNILQLMKIRLHNAGYNVYTAENGLDALDIFYNIAIDMLIVDIMMPKMNGYELVKEIKSDKPNVPVIMVTAKGTIEDKSQGFFIGVDDYMVKPTDFDELLMRMNAIFRRAKIVNDKKITVGSTVLDYDTLTISDSVKNLKITLTKKEFSILYKLLSYPERSFTKWQLFDEFWGYASETDESAVKVFISKIRKQIEIFDNIDIETVIGIGYRGVRHEK